MLNCFLQLISAQILALAFLRVLILPRFRDGAFVLFYVLKDLIGPTKGLKNVRVGTMCKIGVD